MYSFGYSYIYIHVYTIYNCLRVEGERLAMSLHHSRTGIVMSNCCSSSPAVLIQFLDCKLDLGRQVGSSVSWSTARPF